MENDSGNKMILMLGRRDYYHMENEITLEDLKSYAEDCAIAEEEPRYD